MNCFVNILKIIGGNGYSFLIGSRKNIDYSTNYNNIKRNNWGFTATETENSDTTNYGSRDIILVSADI